MSRRHAVTPGCVLAITALTLTAVPAAAERPTAQTPGAPAAEFVRKPPPGMVEALQRDLHLTGSRPRPACSTRPAWPRSRRNLRRRLGDRFGGAWFAGTIAQTLVVATTDPADAPQIVAAGARPRSSAGHWRNSERSRRRSTRHCPATAPWRACATSTCGPTRSSSCPSRPQATEALVEAAERGPGRGAGRATVHRDSPGPCMTWWAATPTTSAPRAAARSASR